MNELNLFTGGGGGLLGTHLLGYQTIGYVEINDYCQRIIKQRIIDGYLRRAPIYGDIRTFVSDGYAASYKGMVDLLTAGFPCQPYSVAGRRKGENDDRNLWPETYSVIQITQPKKIELENVYGLLSAGCGFDADGETGEELDHRSNGLVGYFGTILKDLAACGYDARWRVLSAAELGAPHKRDRLWLIADRNESDSESGNKQQRRQRETIVSQSRNFATDPARLRRNEIQPQPEKPIGPDFIGFSKARGVDEMADADLRRRGQLDITPKPKGTRQPPGRPDEGRGKSWWTTEPDVGRVVNGVASRVDRLRALGNGQVPIVVKTVFELLDELD